MTVREPDFEYPCPHCGIGFEARNELVEHLEWDHNYSPARAGTAASEVATEKGPTDPSDRSGGSADPSGRDIALGWGVMLAAIVLPHLVGLAVLHHTDADPSVAVTTAATVGVTVGVVVTMYLNSLSE